MKITMCKVGMFNLPGVVLDEEEMTADKIKEMDKWAAGPNGTGKRMTKILWYFKTEAQRSWFIIKWSGDDS